MAKDPLFLIIMAKKFKALRIKNKLNQEDVSFALRLSRVTITNIELGENGLTAENAYKASRLFKCSVSDLFPTEDEYSPVLADRLASFQIKNQKKIEKLESQLKLLKGES